MGTRPKYVADEDLDVSGGGNALHRPELEIKPALINEGGTCIRTGERLMKPTGIRYPQTTGIRVTKK